MALVLNDRVLETCTSPGTGAVTLLGAASGYQTFSVGVGNTNTCYYTIADQSGANWEVGIGTYATAGNTLTRTTVLSSSNAGSLTNFSSGTQNVFVAYPAEKAVYQDANGAYIPASPVFNGNAIISDNSANAALRVTQIGAGNALLVEDSANPDATPTVIDAAGKVVVGHTATVLMPTGDGGLYGAGLEVLGAAGATSSLGAVLYNNAAAGFGGALSLAKSNSATVGAHAVVSNADLLGAIYFSGSDGTNFIRAAQILSQVDGVPGTNDMPGRLVFSTTADGASTPTERMRIDNAGNIGIGGTTSASLKVGVLGTLPQSGGTGLGFTNYGTIASGTTGLYQSFRSALSTQAAAFTLPSLYSYFAEGVTIGAGSAVTTQVGFFVASSLTTATNNYGFQGNIASGTGRYNLFMAGTATNYLAGNTYIGGLFGDDTKFAIGGTLPSAASASYGNRVVATVPSASTAGAVGFDTSLSTTAAAFTLVSISHYNASQGTIGAGSAITSQYGFNVQATLTGATNNYGFHSAIAAGTGRYNLYMTGTASNYMAGSLGIGALPNALAAFTLGKNITGGTTAYGQFNTSTIQSDVTTNAVSFSSNISTQATAFTAANVRHFQAANVTIGAGSSVTTQVGFNTGALSGATNNYAFQGGVAAATNSYNLYMSGTADNYMAGSLGIGGLPSAGFILSVAKNVTGATNAYGVYNSGQIQSDVTFNYYNFYSQLYTATAAFTLGNYIHYNAVQSTIGAGSAVTNQIGFRADSTLTGATNNYGFYGNIASGTGRYNFYAAGTADNYFAGSVGIGANVAGNTFVIAKQLTGATTGRFAWMSASVASDVTTNAFGLATNISTAASAFTLSSLIHMYANQSTIGAGSSVTNQYGFFAESSLTGATNNYGFYGAIASGTGRYNLYMSGTASNYFAGSVGIGTTTMSQKLNVTGASETLFVGQRIQNNNSTTGLAGVEFSSDGVYAKAAIALTRSSGNGGGVLSFYNASTTSAADWATTDARMQIAFNGTISLGAAIGAESLRVTPVASAVNYLEAQGQITTGGPSLIATGSDTNVPLLLKTKGTGSVNFYTSGATLQFLVGHVASAVNYLQVSGQATGGAPILSAQGSDANVNILHLSKGTGGHVFTTGSASNVQFTVNNTTSAVNYHQMTGSATGSALVHSAQGSDADIDLRFTPKGTGVLSFGTYTAGVVAQTGYITIKDAGGTTRRLLVG
jgi:hypothetical protein